MIQVMTRFAVIAAQIAVAIFFAFVGFMKTTASMADLDKYHAWVADLPEWVARAVGISEILCAAVLLITLFLRGRARWAAVAAVTLLINQIFAVIFHAVRGDLASAFLQNLILIIVLGGIALYRFGQQKSRMAA